MDVPRHWTPFEMPVSEVAAPAGEFSFGSRWLMMQHPVRLPEPYVTSYRIPLRPVAGQARALRIAEPGVAGCRWEFTQAGSMGIRNPLPATYVRVDAEGGDPGVLLIEKPFGAPGCPDGDAESPYPPCILESQPGDPFEALLAGTK
jgi:hypothetical protein